MRETRLGRCLKASPGCTSAYLDDTNCHHEDHDTLRHACSDSGKQLSTYLIYSCPHLPFKQTVLVPQYQLPPCGSSTRPAFYSRTSLVITTPAMQSSPIDGKMKKSHSKTCAIVVVPVWLAIPRLPAAVVRRGWMAGITLGWTHAASISQAVQSFRRRSIRCSSGTRMLKSVMLICRTWRNDRSSLRVSGLLGVGHYKSC